MPSCLLDFITLRHLSVCVCHLYKHEVVRILETPHLAVQYYNNNNSVTSVLKHRFDSDDKRNIQVYLIKWTLRVLNLYAAVDLVWDFIVLAFCLFRVAFLLSLQLCAPCW